MTSSRNLITIVRSVLLAVACLATLLAIFVVEENWRGDRTWMATERELKAKGESLDFATFQPPPVPDAQNFFKAPVLVHILYDRPDDPERKRLLAETRLMQFHDLGRFPEPLQNFAALRDVLQKAGLLSTPLSDSAAADVLGSLQSLHPLLDDVREAARTRPCAVLEPRATPQQSPFVSADGVFRLGQALFVHARAEIELGHIDDAASDIFALQRFGNALAVSPDTLLNLLVGVAMHSLAAGAVSNGCQKHVWSDAQLADFNQQLLALHPLTRFRDAMCKERAAILYFVDVRPELPKAAFGDGAWPRWLFHGWAQQNKVTLCRRLDSEILSTFSIDPDRIFALKVPPKTSTKPQAAATILAPFQFVSQLALSNIERILESLGTSADELQLHGVAIAIERHRLAHGHYPGSLDELAPAFLRVVPRGIFDGQPVRYTTPSQSGHQLYSLGKNARDDGGKDDDIVLKLPDAQ